MQELDTNPQQVEVSTDLSTSSSQKSPARRLLLLIVLVGLSIGGGVVWMQSQAKYAQAEAEAKSQLQTLGALILSGSSGEHVGSLNLSLTREQQSFDTALNLAADLRWLEVLDLTGKTVTTEQISKLTHLQGLNSLQVANTGIKDEAVAEIAKLSSLVALHASGNNLTDRALEHIANLSELKVLDVSGNQIRGDFEPLVNLKKLAWLVVKDLPLDAASLETFGALPALDRLTLNEGQVSEEQVQQLRKQRPGIRIDGLDKGE